MKDEIRTEKVIAAEEKFEKARVNLKNAKREAKKELRKAQDNHKYKMGGLVAKYFPECYDYSVDELKRIIAAAIKSEQCKNIIGIVTSEREKHAQEG